MKKILLLVATAVSLHAAGQKKAYTIDKDPEGESKIYNGPITFDDLANEPTFTWLKDGYDGYKPDQSELQYLGNGLKNDSLIVFLGTWCGDSQDLIPQLDKLLDLIHYPKAAVTMYGVDRKKKTKGHEEKKYKITLVPTIIVMENGKEIGRITESVKKSVDADLAGILRKHTQPKK